MNNIKEFIAYSAEEKSCSKNDEHRESGDDAHYLFLLEESFKTVSLRLGYRDGVNNAMEDYPEDRGKAGGTVENIEAFV
jgi:hypothetical protein